MMQDEDITSVVTTIQQKKKYSQISVDLITSIAHKELAKRNDKKAAIKATTSKLHQIGSAYFERGLDYASLTAKLETLPRDKHATELKIFCQETMSLHSSARERSNILEIFFHETLQSIAPVRSILDLACGLNPLALAWIPLHKDVEYIAFDVFCDLCEFLERFFEHVQIHGKTSCTDIMRNMPDAEVQVAFLLKSLPCLEQIEKGIGEKMLENVPAKYILLSYPIHSLGGREKGMRRNYAMQFEAITNNKQWQIQRFDFATELAYLIRK